MTQRTTLLNLYRRLRPGIQPKFNALRSLYEGKKIIVARDKLDVVKGVVQKVRLAFLLRHAICLTQ